MTKTTSEDNARKLMGYPLLNVCPNIAVQGFDKLTSLLSSSYSRVISKEQLESDLVGFSKNPILNDILDAVAISSNRRSLTIELVEGKMNEYYLESQSTGFVSYYYNRIVISENEHAALNKKTFMHEMAHKAMIVIFKNGSNPYKNDEQKQKYLIAIRDVLFNAVEYIKQQYKLFMQIGDNDYPYDVGKHISEIISGKLLSLLMKDTGDEIINIFKNHPEIDVSSRTIPNLSGLNCIEMASIHGNFRLVKKLINIDSYENQDFSVYLEFGLKQAIKNNDIEAVKDAIEIKPKLNSAELEAFKEALEVAQSLNNHEIIKVLKPYIEDNDTWYNCLAGFIPRINISLGSEDSIQKPSDVLEAIKIFLAPIIEQYDEAMYDREFIANYIGVITAYSDNAQVLEIMRPMTDYFKDVIHSEFFNYQHIYDESSFCAMIPEYGNVYY